MTEPNEAHEESDKAAGANNKTSRAHTFFKLLPVGLWLIAASGLLCLAVLTAVSVLLPNMNERVKFFTASALNVLILAAIAVQALIYRRQSKIMESQLNANDAQTKVAEASAIAAKISAKAAERSVEIAQIAFVASERAYVGITEVAAKKLEVGKILTLGVTWHNGGKTPAKA